MSSDNLQSQELSDRLKLIEEMMVEGRRSTTCWAWSFVLWGVAYYAAIAWASLAHFALAWPIVMVGAAVLTGFISRRVKRHHPATTGGRAISAAWSVMGIALFVLLMSLSISGRYEAHTFIAIVGAMLAVANGISGMVLKWKMQMACALVWLGMGVAACFVSEAQASILFLAAIFFCQIVFGIYLMVLESRRHSHSGAVHA